MSPLVILLLVVVFLPACIWLLHRNQQRRQRETAELTAPLSTLEGESVPDFALVSPPVAEPGEPVAKPGERVPEETTWEESTPLANADADIAPAAIEAGAGENGGGLSPVTETGDNWPARVRALREAGDLDAALHLSESCFPRVQAFQQAALVLRQKVRNQLDRSQPADDALRQLYNLAALADLFRSGNPIRPVDPEQALAAVREHDFDYALLGLQRLKLLTKGDIRALEQLWGQPTGHRHAEEVLGRQWMDICHRDAGTG